MGFQKIDITRIGPDPKYFVNFGKVIKEGMNLQPIRDYFQNKVDQYKLDVEGMVKIPDANADIIQPGLLDATQELKNEYLSLTQLRKTTATNSENYVQAGKRLQEINSTLNQYDVDVKRIDAIQKEFMDNPYMYDNILDGHHLSDAGEIYLDLSRGGMLDNMSSVSGYEFRDKLYFTHRDSGKEFSIDELVKPTTPDFEVREKVNKDFGATMELAVTKGKNATINEVLNIETYLDSLDQLETADLVLNNKLNYYTTAGPDGIMGTPDDTDPAFMRSVTAADSALYKQFFIDTFENAEDYLKDPNNDSWKNWIYPGFADKAGLKLKSGLTAQRQGRKFRTQYYSDVLNQGIDAANSLYEQRIADERIEAERILNLKNQNKSNVSKYTAETIKGINNIINTAADKTGPVPGSDASDADLRDYERRYFENLGASATATKQGINVVNKEEAKNLFLKDRTTEKQIIETLNSDTERGRVDKDLTDFMGKIIKGNYNQNIPKNFMSLNHAEIPKQFFNPPQKDQEGVSFVTLTQNAIDLLQAADYIDKSAETLRAGTKRYYNFNAFVSDVKEMVFNRFLPGTTFSTPANLFVVTDLKGGGKRIGGLQGSILTATGLSELFNSIATSGLYPAQELRTASGSYEGPLSNIGVDNP